jgi:hypothetical protein
MNQKKSGNPGGGSGNAASPSKSQRSFHEEMHRVGGFSMHEILNTLSRV